MGSDKTQDIGESKIQQQQLQCYLINIGFLIFVKPELSNASLKKSD